MKKILFLAIAVLLVAGCSNEEEKLKLSDNQISLYARDTKQITAGESATWGSESEFVAIVDEEGLITGNHVGKTIITATSANGEGLCKVEVKARYYLYADPIFDFGASKSSIKDQESRTMEGESETAILFRPDNSSIDNVMYMFESGRMSAISVFVNIRNTSPEETIDYLSERYSIISTGAQPVVAIMLNDIPSKATMTAALAIEDGTVMIMYRAYDDNGTRSVNDIDIEKAKELYDRSNRLYQMLNVNE